MSERQHTAGPWTARPDDSSKYAAWSVFADNDINGFICQTSGNCVPNARLIAAAPDLLAACQFILAILEHPTQSVTDFDADKLRDAIAKATQP